MPLVLLHFVVYAYAISSKKIYVFHLSISSSAISQALGLYNGPSACEVTLKNIDKIDSPNHNELQMLCIFLGVCCILHLMLTPILLFNESLGMLYCQDNHAVMIIASRGNYTK